MAPYTIRCCCVPTVRARGTQPLAVQTTSCQFLTYPAALPRAAGPVVSAVIAAYSLSASLTCAEVLPVQRDTA